jgi:hypothetical protein
VIRSDPDPETIPDKAVYELAIADDLAGRLKMSHPELGTYSISLVGSYPGTRMKVSGRNVRTEQPTEWEFALWDIWQDWGTVNGTATVIYANLAD